MIKKAENRKLSSPLFGNWQETLIFSCLQGIMGEIYVNHENNPTSAMAILGDFCFLAGEPDEELTLFKPEHCNRNFIIMIPQGDEWAGMIEQCYGQRAKKVTRYAIKKEPELFDISKLTKAVAALSSEYSIKMMDEDLFNKCKAQGWSQDLVSQFPDYATYDKLGLGVVILKEDVPVSGASSYARYEEGIEIEIDTMEEYRRKGLAYACGAKLILECLNRNLYPSWDAQNRFSVALSEKLGYHYSHPYTAYEIWE